MDFAVPAETSALLGRIDGFVEEQLIPLESVFLAQGWAAVEPELRAVRARVKAAGLWAPQAARDLGGMGLGLVDHALVSERLGRTPLGHYAFGCQAPDA